MSNFQPFLSMRHKGCMPNVVMRLLLLCPILFTMRRRYNGIVYCCIWQFNIFLVVYIIFFLVLFRSVYISKHTILVRQRTLQSSVRIAKLQTHTHVHEHRLSKISKMVSEHPLTQLLLNEFLVNIGQPALGEDEETSCYLCSDTYLSGDSPEFPIALSCGHKAGSNCVMKWLSPLSNSGHNSCPQVSSFLFIPRAPVLFDEKMLTEK